MKSEILDTYRGQKVVHIEVNPLSGTLLIEFWRGQQLEVDAIISKDSDGYTYPELRVVGEDENRNPIGDT